MSEIKSPFLDNGQGQQDAPAYSVSESGNNSFTAVSDNKSENNITQPTNQSETSNDSGVMEIKKDSNFLKNIIIALIILLILAILGLILWNFFNKNKIASTNNNIEEQEMNNIIETPRFEMSGNNFKASSVVIE